MPAFVAIDSNVFVSSVLTNAKEFATAAKVAVVMQLADVGRAHEVGTAPKDVLGTAEVKAEEAWQLVPVEASSADGMKNIHLLITTQWQD